MNSPAPARTARRPSPSPSPLPNGWITIAADGQTLLQQSPAMRTLLHRHPLADVFQPGEQS